MVKINGIDEEKNQTMKTGQKAGTKAKAKETSREFEKENFNLHSREAGRAYICVIKRPLPTGVEATRVSGESIKYVSPVSLFLWQLLLMETEFLLCVPWCGSIPSSLCSHNPTVHRLKTKKKRGVFYTEWMTVLIINKADRHCLSQFFRELITIILRTRKNTTQNFQYHKHA